MHLNPVDSKSRSSVKQKYSPPNRQFFMTPRTLVKFAMDLNLS